MTDLQKELLKLSDEKYAEFQAKLTPTIEREKFIGVRVPVLRKFAKEYIKSGEAGEFLNKLPHMYYDENMLHSLLLSEINDYGEALTNCDKFLPFVDNWAVCDILSPKAFKKNKEKLLYEIKRWVKSDEPYTVRFGIEMLMSHYLDGDFKSEYLNIPLEVKSDEYYVNMMIAWFYATALAKKWSDTFPIIKSQKLDKWIHNKTIQKAAESYRITDEQKQMLKELKIQ